MIWTIILRFAIQDISVEGKLQSLNTKKFLFLDILYFYLKLFRTLFTGCIRSSNNNTLFFYVQYYYLRKYCTYLLIKISNL